MSIINCPSCGMRYDGTGMQPGVKFQCTECGAMVTVGGAPRPAPAGRQPRGPQRAAGGPARRQTTRQVPQRSPGPGGAGAGPYAQGAGFGPPRRSSNTGLFVGLGIGAAVLLIVIIAVVASNSGSTSEEDPAAVAKREAEEREAEMERQREETRLHNEALSTTFSACLDMSGPIETALRNEDAAALSSMFDWGKYETFNRRTMGENHETYANDKLAVLYAEGKWDQDEEGLYTGTYSWSTTRSADSLRKHIMEYIKDYVFGAPEIYWHKDKSILKDSRFSFEFDGVRHVGNYMFFEVAGSSIQFWVGGEIGGTNVKIINFVDKSAFSKLQAKMKEQNPARVDTSQRDPYNPDRDPRNPDRQPGDGTDYDPDANLPAAGKTGRMPKGAALVNVVNYAEDGLNERRLQNVRDETSLDEKHATMGALIDKLIDAHKSNDRRAKANISLALYNIWGSMVAKGWEREHLVYDIDGVDSGGQSTSDMPIRRWLAHYNDYLEIMGGG